MAAQTEGFLGADDSKAGRRVACKLMTARGRADGTVRHETPVPGFRC